MNERELDEYTDRMMEDVMVDLIEENLLDRVYPLDMAVLTMLRTGEIEYVWQLAEQGAWEV